MSEFRRLCVLDRVAQNATNLCFHQRDGFQYDSTFDNVLCPPDVFSDVIEKIAVRSHMRDSKIRFFREETGKVFDPSVMDWTRMELRGMKWKPLPEYKTQLEIQFTKFLHEAPGTTYETVNPMLKDVRRHCANNHLPMYLFRGSLDEQNHLGEGPGLPYWVGIPREGVVPVHTSDPDRIKRATCWHRMGLSWLGKIMYVQD